ncbi:MAG: D-alanyl-D-alanine carboxypeptidase [Oscillospiraceae bacterium]|nr:D-alanyl-D-alanine carboxypeptidase [Oscillospiraceae bacterium]
MKKIKIFPFFIAICLFLTLCAPAASALDAPPLHSAKAVVLADMDSGRLLYEMNKDERRSPASLTKIMTVLLAVEAYERGDVALDEMVTAQADCLAGLDTSSSTSGIQPGEIISFEDLLYCAMVHSANEACNVLAYRISGSVPAFVELMNRRAEELGCTDTHFSDPNGLSNENHYTTAYEMYLITREALRHPLFAEICNTRGYDMAATNLSPARSFANSNALISADSDYGSSYVYPPAAGVKTGFTQLAGYCLVSTAEKDGVQLLAVVMGCDGWLNAGIEEYENFSDTIKLYNWAFDNFSYRQAVSSISTVTRVQVEHAAESDAYVNLRPQSDVTLLLPKDLNLETVELRPVVYDGLEAPIEAGTVLGRAEILIGGESYGSVNLVNATKVELSRREFMSEQVHQTLSKPFVIVLIVLLLVLAIGYLTMVLRYRAQRRKYLRRKRELAARRAARERGIDVTLSPESSQRLAVIVDEEIQRRNQKKEK